MRRPPVEYLIAHAYARHYSWLAKVERLPGSGLWFAWLVGEYVPANDDSFETCGDAQPMQPQDTLTP